jgi:zinc protease
MLMRGNSHYTRQQLDDEFARLKIEGSLYRFDTTRAHLAEALALVAQVLKEPTFPATEFEQLKKLTLANLESQRHQPNAVAGEALEQHFNQYPKGDWRASETIDEAIASVNAITLDDIKAFHHEFYGASKGELAIVGDVDATAIHPVIERAFGQWASSAPYTRISVAFADIPPIAQKIDTPDKENGVYVARVNLNLRDDDPDYPALVVANYLFGGGSGLNSRLMERIRQKDGLSYGGGSGLHVGSLDYAASFSLSAIAAPQNLTKVDLALKEELARVIKEGFSQEEVARAKSGIKQQAVQARSHDGTLAQTWIGYQYLQRTFVWSATFEQKVSVLTAEQVSAAFKKWIDPSKLTIITAGSEAKIEVKK